MQDSRTTFSIMLGNRLTDIAPQNKKWSGMFSQKYLLYIVVRSLSNEWQEGQDWTIPWLVPPLCCSRKYPYPSHGGVFSLNPPPAPPEIPFYCHTFLQKIGLLKPPSQLEFPLTFLGVGMDLFWNYTLCCWVAKSPVHSHWGWQIALAIKTLDISLAQLQGH